MAVKRHLILCRYPLATGCFASLPCSRDRRRFPGHPFQAEVAKRISRGSHTHTLVIDPNDKDNVYIYISGTGLVRQTDELAGCSGGADPAANPNTSLFSIDIIQAPLAHPELAKIVSSPRLFTEHRPPRAPTSVTTSRSTPPSGWPPGRVRVMESCWTYATRSIQSALTP
jgi:hypothetical protein